MNFTFSTILSILVGLIGLIMLATFFKGVIFAPPVLSGLAFLLLGVKGVLDSR